MTKSDRFQALDAWRGLSAVLVALEHFRVDSVLHQNGLVLHGYRFVDFFFVLSGFVIAHAYRDRLQRGRPETRSFLIRRLGRLWPLHATLLLVFIAIELFIAISGLSVGHHAFTDRNTLIGIPANLFLVQGLGLFDHLTWNLPSWSISVEAFAYVLFASVCAIVPSKRIEVAAIVLMVAGMLVVLLLAPHGMGSTFDFGVFRCVYGFMAGVLVRAIWEGYRPRAGTTGEVIIVIALGCAVIWLPSDWPALLVTPLFAVAVLIFASESGALSRALRSRVPQALGTWSYSIYMIHELIVFGFLSAAMLAAKRGYAVFTRVDNLVTIIGPTWFTTAVVICYIALVIAVASLTYRYIEMPGQVAFGRWAQKRA